MRLATRSRASAARLTLAAARLVVLVATAARLDAQGPAPAADSAARAARVERSLVPLVRVRGRSYPPATIERRMRALGVPAVSVAVVDSGRVAWARAYGLADVGAGRRATPATLFQAASMSKPVAAFAALRLVAAGHLALDDDVNARLTSWRVPASAAAGGQPVTLRRLMTHTAGLTVHGFPGYAADSAVPTTVQVLDGTRPANTAPVRVDVAPGTRWRYSGGGITVMQLLMTDVARRPFAALMQEQVLGPAGMSHSTFEQPLPAHRAADAATGYRRGGDAIRGRYHAYPEMAAAGLWTTPSDLGRWIIAVQRAAAGASGALLPRSLATEMLTRGMGGWGLGVGVEGAGDSLRFSHGGSNEGFRGQFVGYAAGGRGVVVMTNGDAGGPLAAEIVAAVTREYGWPGETAQEIVPVALAAGWETDYVGRYASASTPVAITVAADSSALWATLPSGRRIELVPTGADQFVALGAGPARFERGAGGRVTTLWAGGDRLERAP
jgi:CubicO group peptidase (beta-lactamase class C family)